jgi:hypothetical protein
MGIRSERPSAFHAPLAAKDPGRPGIAMSHKTKQSNNQNRSECKGYPFSLRPEESTFRRREFSARTVVLVTD